MNSYRHDRNWGCRLTTDLTFRGMRTVVLENQLLRITVLIDKGTDIIEFLYKPRDLDLMWRSPLGVRNPAKIVASSARSDGAFLDFFQGGWQEILPNGGAPATHANAEFGLHGEISLVPWEYQITEDHPGRVSLRLWVRTYRTPFYLEKSFTLIEHQPVLLISERLVNEGHERLPFMWGHHPGFGAPLLEAGARIHLPAEKLVVHEPDYHPNARLEPAYQGAWPLARSKEGEMIDISHVLGPEQKSVDLLYATKLRDGWAALVNPKRNIGVGLAFSKEVFRTVWLWQVYGGYTGSPWFGRTYNLGLEPWSSYPSSGLNEAMRRGTELWLDPNEELHVELAATVFEDITEVRGIDKAGRVHSA